MQKAHEMIQSGMQKVQELRKMVSETKQNLIDQKRLAFLENMYKEKIYQDEREMNK